MGTESAGSIAPAIRPVLSAAALALLAFGARRIAERRKSVTQEQRELMRRYRDA